MPLLRHNVVLLDQKDLVDAPLLGPAFRIRPSDGDTQQDGQQRWWALVDLARDGDSDGQVTAVVSTSFDGVVWYTAAKIQARRAFAVVELVELESLAPLVRVETRTSDVLPPHRLTVRLASDGPFVAVPG